MNRMPARLLTCAIAMCLVSPAFAENSEKETPPEEYELAARTEPMPEAVKHYVSRLQNIDLRYPDSAEVDIDRFMAEEGEALALDYCAVLGFKGACTVESEAGAERMVALDDTTVARMDAGKTKWWQWLIERLFNVGVIPEADACPAPFQRVEIYMDDEDRKNANGREGWQGAIVSNNNTRYRFCKLDTITALSYRPLPKEGDAHDYAVLNMGILCPSGARRVIRVEENEIWRNANSASGVTFPNFKVYNTWFNFYCHFDGGAKSILGHMGAFPKLGFAHGVFAPSDLPAPYALKHGWVYQDDEDTLNWNAWILGHGDTVMNGGRNTWRGLAKVE
ncbi:MAG: hypothetical protein E6Q88_05930 [Lysobacteraceae bacterium]|nr:MAG: hypothetical protein E6Q88_05930 [Xanthomonadaceae bacterium]